MAMFGKDDGTDRSTGRGSTENTLSIISAGTVVSGDIECAGVLRVDGRVDGSVRNARQVMLSREGTIHGDVSADEVVLGGVVDGAVTATTRLELQTTAVVNGDISTKSIVVMEGARINGSVRMTELALVGRPEDARETKDARAARKM